VAFLGQSVTCKARVVYSHTPDWEYFDLLKNAPYKGWDSSSYRIEMQAVPVEDWDGYTLLGQPGGHHAERRPPQ
jgi:hypothetical protein